MLITRFSKKIKGSLNPLIVNHFRLLSSGVNASKIEPAKPFTDIPLVKGRPLIGSALEVVQNLGRLHELLESRVKEYGPIYREQLGPGASFHQVFTANVDDWQHVLRGEVRGKPAGRMKLWSLDAYTKKKGMVGNIFNSEGKDYESIKEGAKPLMQPKNVSRMIGGLGKVTDDLMECIARDAHDISTIADVRKLIHKWTFECAGSIVFKIRFGLLAKNNEDLFTKDMLKFHHGILSWFGLL